jgi:8-oxo-dGTP diphosphatase
MTHKRIHAIVSQIKPFDTLERNHIEDTLAWIESGAPLFRIEKPDVPNKHLCSYFVLLDESVSKVLLVDHKKSLLCLPPGGHVDADEDPKERARRECLEELRIQADFWCDSPLFLTSTVTVGLTAGHIDVSLWYVLKGNHHHTYTFDPQEFNGVRWFGFDEIPYERSDPHMRRFMNKLQAEL